jgi:hypothetical protein
MGTRSATGDVSFKAQATVVNILDDGSQASSVLGGQMIRDALDNGINDNQINRALQIKDIAILDGNFVDFNIATLGGTDIGAGVGNDALGQIWDVEELVLMAVVNREGPGVLEVQATVPAAANIVWLPGGYASNANGGGIRAGGFRMWYEPGEVGLDLVPLSSSVLRLSAAAGQGDIAAAEVYLFGRDDDDDSSSSSTSSASSFSSSQSSTS